MLLDLVSYCPDIELLRKELADKNFFNESGDPFFPLIDRTPTQNQNSPLTVSLVQCKSQEDVKLLDSFNSIENLGTYEEVFADPEKYAKYSAAYPHAPFIITDDETGVEITITPPKKFGVFA